MRSLRTGWRRERVALGAVLLLALGLRAWCLDFDLPYVYHPDVPHNVNVIQGIAAGERLNPGHFHYPSLFYYLQAAAYGPYFLLGKATGRIAERDDLKTLKTLAMANARSRPAAPILLGRMVTVLLSVGTVALAFFLVRRFAGGGVALLAAALVALSPIANEHGRLITPDTPAGFFTLAALWAAIRVLQRGATGDYVLAGLLTGLAAGCKYNAAFVGVAVAAAHFLRPAADGAAAFRTLGRRLADLRLYVAGGVSLLAFVASTPFALFDFDRFAHDFHEIAAHYRQGHAGHEAGSSLVFHLVELLRHEGLALPLALLASLGWRQPRWRELTVLGVFVWGYLALISAFPAHFVRNLLPLLAPFLILAAAGWAVVAERTARWRLLPAGLLVLLLALPLGRSVRDGRRLAVDERAPARAWIAEHLPPGARVLIEAYTPWIDPERYRLRGVPTLLVRTWSPRDLEGIDYVVAASGTYGRYFADPERYPKQVQRYRTIFSRLESLATIEQDGYEVRVFRVPHRPASLAR